MITLTNKEIEILCKAGSLAPSGGNSQPWLVEIKGNRLDIYVDSEKGNTFLDVGRFASVFAVGCFVENVSLAAQKLGLTYELELSEILQYETPIASFLFSNRIEHHSADLYKQIEARHTNRRLSDGRIIEKNILEEVLYTNEGVDVSYLFNEEDKKKAASILGVADAIRIVNSQYRQELMEEFKFTGTGHTEGIEMQTLEMPRNLQKMFQLIKDNSELVNLFPEKTFSTFAQPLILNCSHFCCLFSSDKKLTYGKLLQSGREMQRIWLRAQKQGLALQPWSVSTYMMMRVDFYKSEGLTPEQSTKIKNMKKQLFQLFHLKKNYPLFFFRLSYAKPASARSLHKNWQDFTTVSHD